MNYELYREIWELKYENDPDMHQDKTVDDDEALDDDVFDLPYAAFRTDLAKHKLVWTGSFCSDLWFYVRNEHPLLAICLSPKEHPLGRWERFFIELFIFAIACMWAASVTLYMMSINDDNKYVRFVAYYGYSILGGLVKTVVNSILKAVATCSCLQEEGTRMRTKWECTGYLCMAVWAIVSMGLFGLGLYFVSEGSKKTGESLWKPWILSMCLTYVSGWIISLIITILMFVSLFKMCMEKDKKFGFVITYDDYVNWAYENGELSRQSSSDVVQKRNKAYQKVSQNEMETNAPVNTYDL
eukprot:559386_1